MARNDRNQDDNKVSDVNQDQPDSAERERIIRETREAGLRAQGGGSPDDIGTGAGGEGSGI